MHDRGRKYQRLKAAAEAKEALRKYEPFLVQSKNFECVPLAAVRTRQAFHCTNMHCQLYLLQAASLMQLMQSAYAGTSFTAR